MLSLLVVLSVAGGGLLASGAASAQGQREVFLGTLGRIDSDHPNTDAGLRAATPHRHREGDAFRLLSDARAELADGNIEMARAQLESLVHRFSETAAAEEARTILARMRGAPSASYPATRRAPGSLRAPSQVPGGAANGADSDARAESLRAPSRAAPRDAVVSAELRRVQLDRDFRASTGDRVFFTGGSVELGARARQVLAAQADWLERHRDATITVEAHADDSGSPAANHALARQRGEAVRERLVEDGVAPDRIRVVVFGRDRPIAPCPQADCAAQNRRVITTISGLTASGDATARASLARPKRD